MREPLPWLVLFSSSSSSSVSIPVPESSGEEKVVRDDCIDGSGDIVMSMSMSGDDNGSASDGSMSKSCVRLGSCDAWTVGIIGPGPDGSDEDVDGDGVSLRRRRSGWSFPWSPDVGASSDGCGIGDSNADAEGVCGNAICVKLGISLGDAVGITDIDIAAADMDGNDGKLGNGVTLAMNAGGSDGDEEGEGKNSGGGLKTSGGAEIEAVGVDVGIAIDVIDADGKDDRDGNGVSDGSVLDDGETDTSRGETDDEGKGNIDSEAEDDGKTEADGVLLKLGNALEEEDGDGKAEADGVLLKLGNVLEDADGDGKAEADGVLLKLGNADNEADGDGKAEADGVLLKLGIALDDADGIDDCEGSGDDDDDGLAAGIGCVFPISSLSLRTSAGLRHIASLSTYFAI